MYTLISFTDDYDHVLFFFFFFLPRFVPTIIRETENTEAVNIRLNAPVCMSASTSYRMTVNLELLASGLILLMQLPRKFWMAEVSVRKMYAPFRKHTKTSFFSAVKLKSPSPEEQRKVWPSLMWFYLLFIFLIIMAMVYHYHVFMIIFLKRVDHMMASKEIQN